MLTAELRNQVRGYVNEISTTIDDWRSAIRGDVDAAIKMALRMRMPAEIPLPLDVTMTVLMVVAFDDAAAASVMADLVQRAPLDPIDRAGISTSWRVYKIWRESVVRNACKRGRSQGGGSDS